MPTKTAGYGLDTQDSPRESIEGLPELAILLINEKGEISAASDEARALLAPRSLNQRLPAPLASLVQEALSSSNSIVDRVIELGGAQEKEPIRVTIQPLPGRGKTTLAMILSGKGASSPETHLRRLHRLASVGTLSASMAHEIKNALVAGKTFVELLLEKNQDAELVGIVRREMERIDSLVTQMLQFGRPGRTKHATVKIHELLELSLRLIHPQFKNKSITIERSFKADSDQVDGDDQQLEQAFVNVLLNSMEAMGPNGQLVVATETIPPPQGQKSSLIEIRITDNGGGVAPENLRHLFEPFFTTKQNGTGLGLAITRKIIKEHHGEIRARNNPREGATFRITLPVAPSQT